jgi:hypothetical protein
MRRRRMMMIISQSTRFSHLGSSTWKRRKPVDGGREGNKSSLILKFCHLFPSGTFLVILFLVVLMEEEKKKEKASADWNSSSDNTGTFLDAINFAGGGYQDLDDAFFGYY